MKHHISLLHTNLPPLISWDKQGSPKPSFHQNVNCIVSFHEHPSLFRRIKMSTLCDHDSVPHSSTSSSIFAAASVGRTRKSEATISPECQVHLEHSDTVIAFSAHEYGPSTRPLQGNKLSSSSSSILRLALSLHLLMPETV